MDDPKDGADDKSMVVTALSALLQDLGAEIRSRRDPEYLYTAAAVGAFGAVAWGVAALASTGTLGRVPWWRSPAMMATIGVGSVAFVISRKIIREHELYESLRQDQVRLASRIAALTGLPQTDLPLGLQTVAVPQPFSVWTIMRTAWQNKLGSGYGFSLLVVWVGALAAMAFCLAIFFS